MIVKTLTQPLYAAAGAGDLAVAKLREIPTEYARLQDQAKKVDASTLRVTVEDYSTRTAGKALSAYGDLVNRGEKLVTGIRRQQATQDLAEQFGTARSQAKGARTTARKSASQTKSRTKAAATSTRKTASAAGKAATSGAKKVG